MADKSQPVPDASKRFASPDHLDQRINLIPPAMRVMALSAAVLVVAALVWAVFGSVPTLATGRGVLLADGKPSHTVQPVVSGPVLELLVTRGQKVEADAVIARVDQVSLNTQLAATPRASP